MNIIRNFRIRKLVISEKNKIMNTQKSIYTVDRKIKWKVKDILKFGNTKKNY